MLKISIILAIWISIFYAHYLYWSSYWDWFPDAHDLFDLHFGQILLYINLWFVPREGYPSGYWLLLFINLWLMPRSAGRVSIWCMLHNSICAYKKHYYFNLEVAWSVDEIAIIIPIWRSCMLISLVLFVESSGNCMKIDLSGMILFVVL